MKYINSILTVLRHVLLIVFSVNLISCISSNLASQYQTVSTMDISSIEHLSAEALAIANEPYVLGGENVDNVSESLYKKLDLLGDKNFANSLDLLEREQRSALRLFIRKDVIEQAYPSVAHALKSSNEYDWPALLATKKYTSKSIADIDTWR